MMMAETAATQLRLDEVRFVPTGSPAHARRAPVLPAATRADLTELAIRDNPAFRLWRVEVDREGPSYSVDTVAELAAEIPNGQFWLVIGADQLAAFAGWRDPARITAVARLAVAPRPGVSRADAEAGAGAAAAGRVDWLDMPEIGISATDVRRRLADGRSIRYLVPDDVRRALESDVDLFLARPDVYPGAR